MEIKEIIDILRVCADDESICPACPHYDTGVYGSGTAACYQNLMLEAADTIESQQKRIAELEATLREQEERDNRLESDAVKNEPLTMEDLRQMDGEPYYHVGLQADSQDPHWAILDSFVARHPEDYRYGKRWIAYRSKPKEDAK